MLELLQQIILDDSSVTDVVGSDVFTNYDTPEAVIPSVLMTTYSTSTLSSSNRASDVQHYQIKLYAMQSGVGAADSLGKKVRAAVDGRSGGFIADDGVTYDLLSLQVNDYDIRTDYTGTIASIEMDVVMNVVQSSEQLSPEEEGGFGIEFTGAFAGGTGIIGANTDAIDIPADTYTHLQFDNTIQSTTDAPYWSDPTPVADAHIGKGLFGGAYLPQGITDVYKHDYTWPDGGTGAISFDGIPVGGLVRVRIDFLVQTAVANTTIEAALDWNTRDDNDDTTFQFYLTGTPVFFGQGTPGQETLVRTELSGYIASNEDANAIIRPVLKANNLITVKPLSVLTIIQK